MPDFADDATDLQEAHLARSLAGITAAIPAGVAGECDNCGDEFPRLVGGLCGFCRDGRRPPLAIIRTDPDHHQEEKTDMGHHSITIPADDATSRAITLRAQREEISLGRAALLFVQEALQPAAAEPLAPPPSLGDLPLDDLFAELRRRMGGVTAEDYAAALERAAMADHQLATVKAKLAELAA